MIECLKCQKFFNQIKLNAEIIDLKTLRPLDKATIIKSAKKTKKVYLEDSQYYIEEVRKNIIDKNTTIRNERIIKKK